MNATQNQRITKIADDLNIILNAEIELQSGTLNDGQTIRNQMKIESATRSIELSVKMFNSSLNSTPRQTAPAITRKIGDGPATPAQTSYLLKLNVRIENGMSKCRASQLIDAAKLHILGSVNGFYTDGSN